jgi:spore germination cell wall hydrolase CwlJ-like protein
MAHAIYYEARGERFVGMLAVANVIMNRSQDPNYPSTICEVTRQRTRNICQFEYYCKVGNRIPPVNDPQWQMANDIALHVMSGNLPDITDGALRFHAIGNAPTNRNAIRIGAHLFYRR